MTLPSKGEQYLNLKGASIVGTEALEETQDTLADVLEARAMMCVHGDAGLGKTLSVVSSLRALAPENSFRVQFRTRPTNLDIRSELHSLLGIGIPPPRRPVHFDAMLKEALAERFRVFVCDEAQWFNREAFEYWRYLWDDLNTDMAVVFIGGGNCYDVLSGEPMLASRIYAWQEYRRMSVSQVQAAMPVFHPVWKDVSEEDIGWVDENAAHGNFRAWAKITRHVCQGLERTDATGVTRDLLRWVFSRTSGRART